MYVCSSLTTHAQILPVTTEDIFPTIAAEMTHNPLTTSAYSFSDVPFSASGEPPISQDLYIFSFNGGNYVRSGVAWYRRQPGTNIILDQGYINVPVTKKYMNVGIIQDYSTTPAKTYAIVSYTDWDNGGAAYDLYSWGAAGLAITPTYTVHIGSLYDSLGESYGDRISMDCVGLRKVAFAWDERRLLGEYGEILNVGGIFVKTFMCTSSNAAPFTTLPWASGSLAVNDADNMNSLPDVAIGDNGNIVRIAYMDNDTSMGSTRSIYVRADSFATITATAFGAILFTSYDAAIPESSPLATSVFNAPNADHIHIDCPDVYDEDIWSMVYSMDANRIVQVTKPVGGGAFNVALVDFPSLSPDFNCIPVVSYVPNASYINVGWYSKVAGRFVASRRKNDGIGNIFSPYYFVINNHSIDYWSCGYNTRLAFSRNNVHSLGLFMAYPFHVPGGLFWGDMRTKTPKWSPSPYGLPFSETMAMPEDKPQIVLAPNPVNDDVLLHISNYDGSDIQTETYDVGGNLIKSTVSNDLTTTNQLLRSSIQSLPAGIYLIKLKGKSYNENIKFTKQ